MAGKTKIDRVKLSKLLRAGKTQKEAAEFFNCSEAAISKAKRELSLAVCKNAALESAPEIVNQGLDAAQQLLDINKEAHRLLDTLEKDPKLKIKVLAEIRAQLKLQLEIFQTLYDLEAVRQFQEAVLEIIGSIDPKVRDAIIYALKKRSAVRSALRIH